MEKNEELAKLREEHGEAGEAYIAFVGEEYATLKGFEDSYIGEYENDEDFAREMADQLGEIDIKTQPWPQYCIDWEFAARELMYDYSAQNGYYFRNV